MNPRDRRLAEEKSQREHQQKQADAISVLEQDPEYPGVISEADASIQVLKRNRTEAEEERLSDARCAYILQCLDVLGGAYLRLVKTLESHKAYATVMQEYGNHAWFQLSALPIEVLPPTPPFAAPLPPELSMRDRVLERVRHWTIEGYKRLDELHRASMDQQKPDRRGYRKEVNAWIGANGIDTLQTAAKRLGVSKSTLKSIMSDKGAVRYSPETLQGILKKIGVVER